MSHARFHGRATQLSAFCFAASPCSHAYFNALVLPCAVPQRNDLAKRGQEMADEHAAALAPMVASVTEEIDQLKVSENPLSHSSTSCQSISSWGKQRHMG